MFVNPKARPFKVAATIVARNNPMYKSARAAGAVGNTAIVDSLYITRLRVRRGRAAKSHLIQTGWVCSHRSFDALSHYLPSNFEAELAPYKYHFRSSDTR